MAGTRIGQRVGPFELTEQIGGDGTSMLFRAVRPAGSREPRVVAIRVAEDPRDERAGAWIRNEYDVLRALSESPQASIPRPYGYYASQVAVAIEDVGGVSLSDALRLRFAGRVPLDAATAVDILVELAQTLRHAHSTAGPQGPVVHGHLNPDCVRLTPEGRVKLMGFGRPPNRKRPAYTPPEQAANAFLDARSDQWTLGSLGVEMLLGQPVYHNAPDPMGLALSGRVGPWLDRLERRWPEVCRVLARCLAPAAGDRYHRDADLVRDLLSAGRTIGGRADVTALVGRVQANLPRPAPVQPASGAPEGPAPAPAEGPAVQRGIEPKVDPTLIPSEDDIDPDSVRGAALRPPPDRPRPLDDADAASEDVPRSEGGPVGLRATAGPVEEEVTEALSATKLEANPNGPGPGIASSDADATDDDDTRPDPPPRSPRPAEDETPSPPAEVGTGDAAPEAVDSEAADNEAADNEAADSEAADDAGPVGLADAVVAVEPDGPALGPLDLPLSPNGDSPDDTEDPEGVPADGLRWTEMSAVVLVALLFVTGAYFLAWRFL